MAASQKFCLKWNNFQNSVTSVFDSLRQDEELVDITLCCEGRKIKAHRMMLSACSPYFRDLFKAPRSQPPDRSRLPSGPPPPPPPVRQRPRESAEPPASPRLKRRRLSGSSGSRPGSPSAVSAAPPPPAAAAGPRDPAADVMAGPPGAALPPPPPPPVSGADLAEPPPPQHEPPPPPQPAAGRQDYGIKVEKIDIADDDDDVSLEATLGQVSTFEASQFDGSDHSASSHDMSGLLSGLSDRVGDVLAPSASAEDGSAQDAASWAHRCEQCGAAFRHPDSLRFHREVHQGRTACPVCGHVFSRRSYLRQHLQRKHPDHGALMPP
ncbi:Broad-complex core protein isoform 6 [Amphibalanus amphitrite]|uniref:Broad-complex core protein isoform 6 n=1 Tax=Amphibalanus amphitrite TaxID=1232801 RepID=A0A6A4VJX8_AMPAM|nr:Broad-complex core protein isoform 6 [Amphibalanus amphitrite]